MKVINPKLLAQRIEAHAAEDLAQGRVGGLAISVSQNGQSVYRACHGTTIPGGTEPVTDKTIYRMASMTKPVVALAAAILIEEGALSVDAPIE